MIGWLGIPNMFKKSFFYSLVILICFGNIHFAAAKQFLPDAPTIDAKAWIIIDANTGYVIVATGKSGQNDDHLYHFK